MNCKRCGELEAENERLRVQLAGAGCASLGYGTAKPGDYGHSNSHDEAKRTYESMVKAEAMATKLGTCLEFLVERADDYGGDEYLISDISICLGDVRNLKKVVEEWREARGK